MTGKNQGFFDNFHSKDDLTGKNQSFFDKFLFLIEQSKRFFEETLIFACQIIHWMKVIEKTLIFSCQIVLWKKVIKKTLIFVRQIVLWKKVIEKSWPHKYLEDMVCLCPMCQVCAFSDATSMLTDSSWFLFQLYIGTCRYEKSKTSLLMCQNFYVR